MFKKHHEKLGWQSDFLQALLSGFVYIGSGLILPIPVEAATGACIAKSSHRTWYDGIARDRWDRVHRQDHPLGA